VVESKRIEGGKSCVVGKGYPLYWNLKSMLSGIMGLRERD